jgi:ATP-binding cassette, subfamily B, bacterial
VKFIMLIGALNGAVQRLIDAMAQVQDGVAALERINDLLIISPNPAEHKTPTTPTISGALSFDQVTFAYKDRPVVENFSFTFQAGRTYALVGPSGSGKSSLCQLMLRFYDPQTGAVRIDGHDLRAIQQQHYRQSVAVVLQDPIIFSTSVRDNIDFGVDNPTEADVIRAAKQAQAHEFISELPDGYATRLGERGMSLSGGQRQRIAIARALMRQPKVLILDEATSALDTVTERSIQEVIDHLRGSCTIIVIAHRLSTIRNVDDIVVLDHGHIAEHGSYDDLLAQDGLFARLVEEQEKEQDVPRRAPDEARLDQPV